MKPKISIITLGVNNVAAATEFYTKLGFTPHEHSNEKITFFALEGTWLALFTSSDLAADAGITSDSSGFRRVAVAHNVDSPEKVDATLQEAVDCGATLVKPGQSAEWGGYSGYFADPDGFLWEVAYNPYADLT